MLHESMFLYFRPSNPSADQLIALITSADTYLNGAAAPLTPSSHLTPTPLGSLGTSSGTVRLPGLGVAFVVFPDANATACLQGPSENLLPWGKRFNN